MKYLHFGLATDFIKQWTGSTVRVVDSCPLPFNPCDYMSPVRPFASSLESLSACDMNTIHSMADPHIRVEFTNHGLYCGRVSRASKKRRTKKRTPEDHGRDCFEGYCNSALPSWATCKELAAALVCAGDDELIAAFNAYRDALCEEDLYNPFEFLANHALKAARQDALRAVWGHSGPIPRTWTGVTPDSLPNLLAVPTHDCPILGCADKRK